MQSTAKKRIVIAGVFALVCALAGGVWFTVKADEKRQRAAEAEDAIAKLKRHIEVYYVDSDEYAEDMATLERAQLIEPSSFDGPYCNEYSWTGEISNGRFIGEIRATPRNLDDALAVNIQYAANPTSQIHR